MLGAAGNFENGTHWMLTRVLIVLLIVLNLGVAAWWALRPAPAAPAADPALAGVPTLQLANEHKASAHAVATTPAPAPASGPVAAALPAATVATDGAEQCFRFGPFADAASAESAATTLRASVRKAIARATKTTTGGKGWTVWLPPFADMTLAQAKALEIATAGIKDYYVVSKGAQVNAIMLGHFNSEASAQRRLSELQAKGIHAQLLAPEGAAASAWVDAAAAPGFDAAASQARIGAKSVQPLDCVGLH